MFALKTLLYDAVILGSVWIAVYAAVTLFREDRQLVRTRHTQALDADESLFETTEPFSDWDETLAEAAYEVMKEIQNGIR